ncbi:hypothetical protein Tco_1235054 [Tanacetum coccineum]
MATEDIISIGNFVEVLILNHYAPVRKILGKLSMLQDEEAQNKTNIQEPRMPSMATEDIISIGSFVEVLVLNHYVPVRKILGKLSMLQDEEAQNKTNIQEPGMPW